MTGRAPAPLLVLGGEGLVGHRVVAEAVRRGDVPVAWTAHGDGSTGRRALPGTHPVTGVDLTSPEVVRAVLDEVRPSAVVNCAGIVKQRMAATGAARAVAVNSWLPHELAARCTDRGIRLVHLSTDCVFSGDPVGRGGAYDESARPDPVDLYGRSKLAGEVESPGTCTVRTSVVGRELRAGSGLLEWLLGQRGAVQGWTGALFSGPSSLELARRLVVLALDEQHVAGVHHLAAAPISKHDLLVLLAEAFGLDVEVRADASVRIDRSLDGAALAAATGGPLPDWPTMVSELADDPMDYAHLRRG